MDKKNGKKITSQTIKKLSDAREHKLVYQHNKLVEAKYDLTLQEKRVLLWCLNEIPQSFIEKKGLFFPTINIPVDKFCELVDADKKTGYSALKAVAKRLRSRTLVIEHIGSKDFAVVGWVDRIEYYDKKGFLSVDLSRFLMDFLIDLKSNYTSISLSQTLGLSSFYAIRMFELLKQYEKIGTRKISVEELRGYLGIANNKIKTYNDFKKIVLEIAQKEINEKTDIEFSFKEAKTSRKITDLVFVIKKNKNFGIPKDGQKTKVLEFENESKEGLKKQVLEIGFSRPTIVKIFNDHEECEISKALHVLKYQVSKGGVLNTKAFFRTALKEGWSLEKYKPKKTT